MASYRTAAPVFPNQGVEDFYRRALNDLLEQTRAAVEPVILEAWGNLDELQPKLAQDSWLFDKPELAFDDSEDALIVWYKLELDRLAGRFSEAAVLKAPIAYPCLAFDSNFNEMMADYERRLASALAKVDAAADDLAATFVQAAFGHASNSLKHNLAAALNMRVRFQMTPALRKQLQVVIENNRKLIKSVAEKYTSQLATVIEDSVFKGRDLEALTKALTGRFEVAQSRAELIASDQNNKATAAIDRQRKLDLGITQSMWVHSNASLHPRLSHLTADGRVYDTEKGCLIEGEYIMPGEKIKCGCVSRSVIPNVMDWAGLGSGKTEYDEEFA